MKRYSFVLVLVCVCAVPVRAQESLLQSCVDVVPTGQDIPAQAIEQFNFLCAQVVNSLMIVQPGVGMAFSGGNPVLGTGGTLGRQLGLRPRISVTARANAVLLDMPELFDEFSAVTTVDDPTLPAMEAVGVPIGALQGDVAIGVFNGLSFAPMIGGVGALDLLGSLSFVPVIDEIGISEAILNFGGGARVGILKQGMLVPGVSVSGMFRRMTEITFGDVAAGDAGEFSTDLSAVSLRAVASKGVLLLDFAVGAGYDRYSSDVGIGWRLTCGAQDCRDANDVDPGEPITVLGDIDGELSSSAWNVFGDVSLNLLMLSVIGEVGYQKSIEGLTPADLDAAGIVEQDVSVDALNGGRIFGSFGLRLTI